MYTKIIIKYLFFEKGIKHTIIRFDDNDEIAEKTSLDDQSKLAAQRSSTNGVATIILKGDLFYFKIFNYFIIF